MRFRVDKRLVELRQQFREFYNKNLNRKYTEFEKKRKMYLRHFIWASVIMLMVLFFFIGLYHESYSLRVLFSASFVNLVTGYAVIVFFVLRTIIKDYKEQTKFLVMPEILSFWGNLKYFTAHNAITDEMIRKSGLFKFDGRVIDDLFVGEYKGTKISVSEQKMGKMYYINGHPTDYLYSVSFNGVLIALKFNKKFKGQTVVKGKKSFVTFLRYRWLALVVLALMFAGFMWLVDFRLTGEFASRCSKYGKGMCYDQWVENLISCGLGVLLCLYYTFWYRGGYSGLPQRVMLEDVEFRRSWQVFADDQVEARYLLTPAFMERMRLLKSIFRGNSIDFGFYDDMLLIAVHTGKDMFETTSLFSSALNYHKVQEVICQLYSVFSVVDVLNLSESTVKSS